MQELQLLGCDGQVVEVEAAGAGVLYLGKASVQAVFRDISERRRAREALRLAHEQLKALIQSSPLAIVYFDREGLIRGWNPAAERLFGWSAAEVIGHRLPSVPEQSREESRLIIERTLQGERLSGLELRRLRKDGTWIDISLSTAPL